MVLAHQTLRLTPKVLERTVRPMGGDPGMQPRLLTRIIRNRAGSCSTAAGFRQR